MLVIPDSMKDYVQEVEEWARENRILEKFNEAMMRAHLYGCSWVDPEKARVTLYARDFTPKSFLYSIEFRKKDGGYRPFINGGLIFTGDIVEGRLTRASRVSENTGWGMHS